MDDLLHRHQVDASLRAVGCTDDVHAEAVGQGEILDLVRDVVALGGGDDVPRAEIDRGERGREGCRRVLGERDAIG